MKKIIALISMLLFLAGCSFDVTEVHYTTQLTSYDCDMSAYPGISSVNHHFRQTTVEELIRCAEEKSSGVFYIGYTNCPYCRELLKYLEEVAEELDVYVYYIDAFSEEFPISDESFNNLYNFMYPILLYDAEVDDKSIFTPHIFSIINGEFEESQVSLEGINNWEYGNPSKSCVNKIKQIYRKILVPFK